MINYDNSSKKPSKWQWSPTDLLFVCLWLKCHRGFIIRDSPFSMLFPGSISHALPRSRWIYSGQVKLHCCLLYVINTKVWIYADEILLRWPKDFCSMNIPLVLCWMFALFLTVHSDSTWVSGACSKGRYSEGILCVFLPVPASLLALWQRLFDLAFSNVYNSAVTGWSC
jgi:hypothetical protein